jgi:hypothetical protein
MYKICCQYLLGVRIQILCYEFVAGKYANELNALSAYLLPICETQSIFRILNQLPDFLSFFPWLLIAQCFFMLPSAAYLTILAATVNHLNDEGLPTHHFHKLWQDVAYQMQT